MQPATELFVIMIILFALGICILIGSYMKDAILPTIEDKFEGTAGSEILTKIRFSFEIFDNLFFFGAVGLGIVSVLLAFITPARPAFLFLSIILFAIALLVIPQLANIYQDFTERSTLSAYASTYPMMNFVFQNYPTFLWVFGFLILVVLFAKLKGAGGGTV